MAPLRVKHPPATDRTRKASAEFRLTCFSTAPVILSIQLRSPPQGSACFTVKKSFIDVFYHQIRNGIQGYTTT
jgi:hypothetical protein